MTTDRSEAIRFMKIVLDWCSPQVARSMMDDMQFYIGDVTDNESIRDSIKMVRQLIYDRAEENLMLDDEPPYKATEQGLPADYQLDN
jgi:KaiC/GvpD/RAD55 family RecA-like ATPase|tara:strand:- start:179 stop:439 length:261 start_codon:yes stop_codon:yes gene_type:complete